MKSLQQMKKIAFLLISLVILMVNGFAQELDLAIPMKNELVYKSLNDLYEGPASFDVPIIRTSTDVDLHFTVHARLFYLTVDAADDYPLLGSNNTVNTSTATFLQEVNVPYKITISGLDKDQLPQNPEFYSALSVSPNKDLASEVYFVNEGELDGLGLNDVSNVKLEIDAADLPLIGQYPQSVREKLIVEVYIEYPRYQDKTVNYKTSFETSSTNTDLKENEVLIDWSHPDQLDGVLYELEWVHMPASSMIKNTSGVHIAWAVDWENARRIQTRNTNYLLNVIYEEGYIISRVRTVRYQLNSAKTDIINKLEYGVWSIPDNIELINVSPLLHNVLSINQSSVATNITVDDFDGFNWQYNAVYANEGKKVEDLSIFDGSNHNRQKLSMSNSDEPRSTGSSVKTTSLIAQESNYNFEGQPIMQILPTPLLYNGVKYQSNINQFNGAKISRAQLDDETDPNYFPQVLDKTTPGAAQYYSDLNPFYNSAVQDENAFIPDAKGYPYSRTELMNDGSGRVKAEYGIGDRLASDDDGTENNRFFYSKPTQPELELLFGTNVGEAKFYKKNVTIDGNGVMSMAYIDQKDRTIATALAGEAKEESKMYSETASRSMEVDLLANDNVVFNDIERSYSISQPLFVAESGDYTFTYTLDVVKFFSCINPTNQICFDCPYDYTFQILDEDGVLITEATLDDPIVANCETKNYRFFNVVNKDPLPASQGGHAEPTIDLPNSKIVVPLLAPKNYTLIQSIKLNTSGLDGMTETYMQDPNCDRKTLEEFISDELDVAEFESCKTEFEDPCNFIRSALRSDFQYPDGALVKGANDNDDVVEFIMARIRRVDRCDQSSASFPLDPNNLTTKERDELVYWKGVKNRFQNKFGVTNLTFRDYEEEHYDFFLDYHPSNCKLYTCEELNNASSLRFDEILKESTDPADFTAKMQALGGDFTTASLTFAQNNADVNTVGIQIDDFIGATLHFDDHGNSIINGYIGGTSDTNTAIFSRDLALLAFDRGFFDAIYQSTVFPDSFPDVPNTRKNIGILEKKYFPLIKQCYFNDANNNNWGNPAPDPLWGIGSYMNDNDFFHLFFNYLSQFNGCLVGDPPTDPGVSVDKGIAYMAYDVADHCVACTTAVLEEEKRWEVYKMAYARAKENFIRDFINFSSCAPRDGNAIQAFSQKTAGEFYYTDLTVGSDILAPILGHADSYGGEWFWDKIYDWGFWWKNGSDCDIYLGESPKTNSYGAMSNSEATTYTNDAVMRQRNSDRIEKDLRDLMEANWDQTCSTDFFNSIAQNYDYNLLLNDDAFDKMDVILGVNLSCSVYDLNLASILTTFRQSTEDPATRIGGVIGTGTPYLNKENPLHNNCIDLATAHQSFIGLSHSHPTLSTPLTIPSLPNGIKDISINDPIQKRYVNYMNFRIGVMANMHDYLEMAESCTPPTTQTPHPTQTIYGNTIDWTTTYTTKEQQLKTAAYNYFVNNNSDYWTEVAAIHPYDIIDASDELLATMLNLGASTTQENSEDYLGIGQVDYANSHHRLFFLDNEQANFNDLKGNLNLIFNALKTELRSDNAGIANYPDFEEAYFAYAKIIQNVNHSSTGDTYSLTINGNPEVVKIERAILFSDGTIMVRLLDLNDNHHDDYYYHYQPHNGDYKLSDLTNAGFADFDGIGPVFTGKDINYVQLRQGTSTYLLASTKNVIATASEIGRIEINAEAGSAIFPLALGCEDLKYQNAVLEGNRKYNDYLKNLGNTFKRDYLAHCTQVAPQQEFKMEYNSYERHFTLYYYDQADNLIATVPPEGIASNFKRIEPNGTITNGLTYNAALGNEMADYRLGVSHDQLVPEHSKQTTYQYNADNKIIKQTTPNGGTTYFWYDKHGRLVLSQNQEQYNVNKFSYTLYDEHSRVTESGELPLTISAIAPFAVTREEVWDHFNYTLLHDKKFTPMQEPLVFTSEVLEVSGQRTDVIKTYYDDPILTANVDDFTQDNLRSRVASQAYYTAYGPTTPSNEWEFATHYSYDPQGNVKTILQDYLQIDRLTDHEQRFKRIDYGYDPVSGNVLMVYFQLGMPDAFYHRYAYDAQNRIKSVETSRDGFIWDEDATYTYYQHGPLARIEIGEHKVQGIDYAYTIQGWLKAVNGGYEQKDMRADFTKDNQFGEDAFGFSLQYFDGDYTPISGSNDITAIHSSELANLYNGNIAAKSMHSQESSIGKKYTYDQLNRLRNMDEFNLTDNVTDIIWGAIKADGFRSAYEYDPNGNITSLQRMYNTTPEGGTAQNTLLDDMSYTYLPGSDQLDHVTDAYQGTTEVQNFESQATANYGYDDIGNLIKDEKNEVERIDWYPSGKIKRVVKNDPIATNPNLYFEYDVMGNRIKKEVSFVEGGRYFVKTTYYVRDVQGNVMATYDEEDCRFIQGDEEIENFYYQYSHDYAYYSQEVANDANVNIAGLTAYLNGTTYSKKTELCDQAALVLPTIPNASGLILPHLVVSDYLSIYPDAVARIIGNKTDYFADVLYTDHFTDFLGFVNEDYEAWVSALQVENNEQDFYANFDSHWLSHYTTTQQLDKAEAIFSMNREVANDLRINNQSGFEDYFGITAAQFSIVNNAHSNAVQGATDLKNLMIQIEDKLLVQDPNIESLLNEANAISMVITFANTTSLYEVTDYIDQQNFYNAQSWLPTSSWNKLNNYLHQLHIFHYWNSVTSAIDVNSLTTFYPMGSMDWSQDVNGNYLDHFINKNVTVADIYDVSSNYFTTYNMSNRDIYFDNSTDAKSYVREGMVDNGSDPVMRTAIEATAHLAASEGALYQTEDVTHLSNYLKLEMPEEVLRINYEYDALQRAHSSITNYSPIIYAEELENELGPFNFETPGDCSNNNTFLAAESYDIHGSKRLGVMDAKPDRREENTDKFERHLKAKTYELTDHLNNVVATVSDKKMHPQEVAGNGNVQNVDPNMGFQADVTARYDRFPFGMEILERSKDYSILDVEQNIARLEYKGAPIADCGQINHVYPNSSLGNEDTCSTAVDPVYGTTYVTQTGIKNHSGAANFYGYIQFSRPIIEYITQIDANATYRFEVDVDQSRGRGTEVRMYLTGGRMHYPADISLSAGENASPQEVKDADDKMARIELTGQQLLDATASNGNLTWEVYFQNAYFNGLHAMEVFVTEVRVYKLVENSKQPMAFRSHKPYRYGFQGQEIDNEWNGVAFGSGGIPIWEDEVEEHAIYTDDLSDLSKWTIENACAQAGSDNITISTSTLNCGAYTHSFFGEIGKEYKLTADVDFVSGSGGLVLDWEYYDPADNSWKLLKSQSFTANGAASFDQVALATEAEMRLRAYYSFGSGTLVSTLDNVVLNEELSHWTVSAQSNGNPAATNENGQLNITMNVTGAVAIGEGIPIEEGEVYKLSFDYEWNSLPDALNEITVKIRQQHNNGSWYNLVSYDLDGSLSGLQHFEIERTPSAHYPALRFELEVSSANTPIDIDFDNFRVSKGHEAVAGGGTNGKVAFKYRIHDARLGRWLSPDPLEAHPAQIGKSTYSAMWNNPITNIDPDGRCPRCFGNAGKGAWNNIVAFGEFLQETYETGGDNIVQGLNNLDQFGTLVQYAPNHAKDIFVQGTKQQIVNSIKTAGDPQAAASQAMGAASVDVLVGMLGDKSISKLKTLKNAKSPSLLEPGEEVLFRGDTRSPDLIKSEGGFNSKGSNMDLEEHVLFNPDDGAFISTSTSPDVARKFAGKNGYIYRIEGQSGYDINKILPNNPNPDEFEIAVPFRIPEKNIKGAVPASGG